MLQCLWGEEEFAETHENQVTNARMASLFSWKMSCISFREGGVSPGREEVNRIQRTPVS